MPIIKTYIVPHPPLIIPEIGKGKEKAIHKTVDAYHKIAKDISKINPDTIIVSSPHSTLYADYFHISPKDMAYGDFAAFGAEEVSIQVKYDHDLRLDIINACNMSGIHAGMLGEKDQNLDHATLIPLYFITKYLNDFRVIRISPSGLPMIDHYNLGRLIEKTIPNNLNVVWVASGDLSHKLKEDGPYGLSEEGPEFDKMIFDIVTSGNFNEVLSLKPEFCYRAAECGLGSITMMFGTMDGYDVETKVLSYQDTFGVGYLVAEIERKSINPDRNFGDAYLDMFKNQLDYKRANEDEFVRLARESLEYYIQKKRPLPLPNGLNSELMNKRAGTFVSLHIDGNLRGCIGTLGPTTPSIAEEIIQNAISAGTSDYRFNPVRSDELDRIDYSVDVLLPSERVESINQLDVKKYGLIVKSGRKSGLLLPNIEGVDNVIDQIEIAKRKAGIDEDEDFIMERFQVIRHH